MSFATNKLCFVRILVGAPLHKQSKERTGALWKCPIRGKKQDCEAINVTRLSECNHGMVVASSLSKLSFEVSSIEMQKIELGTIESPPPSS